MDNVVCTFKALWVSIDVQRCYHSRRTECITVDVIGIDDAIGKKEQVSKKGIASTLTIDYVIIHSIKG